MEETEREDSVRTDNSERTQRLAEMASNAARRNLYLTDDERQTYAAALLEAMLWAGWDTKETVLEGEPVNGIRILTDADREEMAMRTRYEGCTKGRRQA